MNRFHVEIGPCGFCGVGTGDHETRNGCIMALTERLQTSRDNFIEVEAKLSAATARASELERAARAVVAADTYPMPGKTRFEATTEAISKLEALLPETPAAGAAVNLVATPTAEDGKGE